jgi:hypothetical protein
MCPAEIFVDYKLNLFIFEIDVPREFMPAGFLRDVHMRPLKMFLPKINGI